MKDIKPKYALVIIGAFTTFYGFAEANWYGIYLIGVGASWVISSFILELSKREITEGHW